MDTAVRIFIKSTTWQCMGFFVMTLIGYVITGSISAGGSIAIISTLLGFVTYFLHELVWSKVKWGRR